MPALSHDQLGLVGAMREAGATWEAIAEVMGVEWRTLMRIARGRHECGHCGARFPYIRDLVAHAVTADRCAP